MQRAPGFRADSQIRTDDLILFTDERGMPAEGKKGKNREKPDARRIYTEHRTNEEEA